MSEPDYVDILRIDTTHLPVRDRFGVLTAGRLCDYSLESAESLPFDTRFETAEVGPLTVGSRTWLNPSQRAKYRATRSPAHIRANDMNAYQFMLHLNGANCWQSHSSNCVKQPGELYVIDTSKPFDSLVTAGDTVWLGVPRALLPFDAERLHGQSLTYGAGQLLGDFVLSLVKNLPRLTVGDIPYVAQAATQILTASVLPHPDAQRQAEEAIGNLLIQRVQRYINKHLLSADLNPDQICKNVGLSRSKLYQLFEHTGGVMRQIQRTRLKLIYLTLADPNRDERIGTISERHGFTNQKYFSRLFKAQFGHTPRETLERVTDECNK